MQLNLLKNFAPSTQSCLARYNSGLRRTGLPRGLLLLGLLCGLLPLNPLPFRLCNLPLCLVRQLARLIPRIIVTIAQLSLGVRVREGEKTGTVLRSSFVIAGRHGFAGELFLVRVWQKAKEPPKKATKNKAQSTLKISTAHSSQRALVVEAPERSDHSDSSDDESFINDSPIPSPKASVHEDYDSEMPAFDGWSPSPLDYIPDSESPLNQIAPLVSFPETDVRSDCLTEMDTRSGEEDLPDHDEQEIGSSTPITVPDAVPSHTMASAPQGIAVSPNLAAEPATRRSGRKRKEREDLGDWSAALESCICGSPAAPLDDSEHPNAVLCKNEGCETKWYHLRCLEWGSVPDNWVCEACLSAGFRPYRCHR
ncbi:hypothetical protein B0H10DRAFT_2218015 [Mycena sp. CBHHK59/15]|nr:hypothetical protein B0H10DRAFT_2218015 [Mycena sp. CBHHK59/15]